MANELTLSATIQYSDSDGSADSLQVSALVQSVSVKNYQRLKQSIPTAGANLGLGNITSLGWCLFVNRDPTNYITIKTVSGGTVFATLYPGCFAFLNLAGLTAPWAQANSAACTLEYFLANL